MMGRYVAVWIQAALVGGLKVEMVDCETDDVASHGPFRSASL